MRILLSAYACEPVKGSEPGVGWNWALTLARRGHEVRVLTRANNREAIEAGLARLPSIPNLHFEYFDLPPWQRRWKKGQRGVHIYSMLWQWGAVESARRLHQRFRCDLVHHITFGVFRQPSFMWRLGIPFMFGPLGGGERAPFALRRSFGWRDWLKDLLRDVANTVACIDPFLRKTFAAARLIVVRTPETLNFVPRSSRTRTIVNLGIGIADHDSSRPPRGDDQRGFRVLFVGRFIYWKGVHLALWTFAQLIQHHPNARLTLVGKGSDKTRWAGLAANLGLTDRIQWIEWLPQEQMADLYATHDAFLFPSLHESGGSVVLEALNQGLPVVCLKLGGPAMLVDDNCGRAIATTGLGEGAVVDRLAAALLEIATSTGLRTRLRDGALAKAAEYRWECVIGRVYDRLELEFLARDQASGA